MQADTITVSHCVISFLSHFFLVWLVGCCASLLLLLLSHFIFFSFLYCQLFSFFLSLIVKEVLNFLVSGHRIYSFFTLRRINVGISTKSSMCVCVLDWILNSLLAKHKIFYNETVVTHWEWEKESSHFSFRLENNDQQTVSE